MLPHPVCRHGEIWGLGGEHCWPQVVTAGLTGNANSATLNRADKEKRSFQTEEFKQK